MVANRWQVKAAQVVTCAPVAVLTGSVRPANAPSACAFARLLVTDSTSRRCWCLVCPRGDALTWDTL